VTVTDVDAHPLDNPAWRALTGPHAHFAETYGNAARYPADVAPFVAIASAAEPAWDDVAQLVGPDTALALPGVYLDPPPDWTVLGILTGVQMDGSGVLGEPDPEAVTLGPADVPEMLDLVERTQPGPFRPRTVEMGAYLGIRHNGALIAMAGERMHPPGWTEVSAVCTDPAYRGRGLASRLVSAVVAGIRARGENPFLHASATNTAAIRLYESMGFTVRKETVFRQVRTPA